jgi:RNase H-like domain found in reverse transcriptase
LLKGTKDGKQTGLFDFYERARQALSELKRVFSEAPMLHYFNSKRLVRAETDASGYAIRGILSQKFEDEKGKPAWHSITYLS